MNVKEFKELTKNLGSNTEIRMNCSTSPTFANSYGGELSFSGSDGFAFDPDWDNRRETTVSDFRKEVEEHNVPDDEEIISWDQDDGNMIHFSNTVIDNGCVILG